MSFASPLKRKTVHFAEIHLGASPSVSTPSTSPPLKSALRPRRLPPRADPCAEVLKNLLKSTAGPAAAAAEVQRSAKRPRLLLDSLQLTEVHLGLTVQGPFRDWRGKRREWG
jgi:hypothetical protein